VVFEKVEVGFEEIGLLVGTNAFSELNGVMLVVTDGIDGSFGLHASHIGMFALTGLDGIGKFVKAGIEVSFGLHASHIGMVVARGVELLVWAGEEGMLDTTGEGGVAREGGTGKGGIGANGWTKGGSTLLGGAGIDCGSCGICGAGGKTGGKGGTAGNGLGILFSSDPLGGKGLNFGINGTAGPGAIGWHCGVVFAFSSVPLGGIVTGLIGTTTGAGACGWHRGRGEVTGILGAFGII
jgi:hypothetical protein